MNHPDSPWNGHYPDGVDALNDAIETIRAECAEILRGEQE
jgi:hypothetical protein